MEMCRQAMSSFAAHAKAHPGVSRGGVPLGRRLEHVGLIELEKALADGYVGLESRRSTMGQVVDETMTPDGAAAEVFMMAFRALSRDARAKFIEQLAQDEEVWEDLEAAALWEQRRNESRRSFDDYLA